MTLKSLLASVLLCSATCASASVLTFDNVPVTDGVSQPGFSSSGFQFSDNVSVVDVSPGSLFGDGTNGGHSGMYASLSLSDFGGSMQMTRIGGGLMNVTGLWIHGWLGSSDNVVIEGYRDGVATQTVNYAFGETWDSVTLDFSNIDMLSLSSFGNFFIDDLNATPQDILPPGTVPEPTTPLLFAAALAALFIARVRRA